MSAAARAASLVCFALAMCAGLAMAQPSDTLKTLLAFKLCSLAGELRAVYDHPANADDRSFVLRVKDAPQNYVRCEFADNGRALSCVASSLYYAEDDKTRSHKLPMPAEKKAALAKLGFDTGTEPKDFSYRRAIAGEPDFDSIVTLMLAALHDACDVREDTHLVSVAPIGVNLVTVCRY